MILLRSALLLGALLVAPVLRAGPSVVPTVPPDQLHPGQRALVRTVFAGDSIETFDAEIVGVLRSGRAAGDVVLARATSPRVIQSGVAQGMSGSPVYVDGKLVGALSSGWGFSKEPIFGITPIGEMLDVLDLPEVRGDGSTAGPAGLDPLPAVTRDARFRELRWSDGEPGAPAPTEGATPPPLALPVAAAGLHPSLAPLVRDAFAPFGLAVAPSGRATARPARTAIQPGSAVAVDVLRGDLNFSAIGTVTYVDGDRVLLFGHPFFGSGDVRLPMSEAEIVTILPSLNNSFKLGAPGRTIGVATQDRRAAVAGRLGAPPRLLPFGVRIERPGLAARTFRFESVEDRALLGQLVGTAAANSLLELGGEGAQQSIAWTLDARVRGHGRLRLDDLAAGDAPIAEVIAGISAPIRFLANNPFERVTFDSLQISLRTVPGRDQSTLRQASLASSAVRAGGTLEAKVEIERWRGAREVRTVRIEVPAELPPGRYTLWLGGGSELTRLESARVPARFRPVGVADAMERLAASRASTALYATIWAKAPDVTADGEDFAELPTSAIVVMSPTQTVGDRQRRADWALMVEQRFETAGVLRGEIALDFQVDRLAP